MKLLTVRVIVAVDDDITLELLKPRLRAMISEHGTEFVGDNPEAGPRIHWGTADVRQGPEQRVLPLARKRVATAV